MGNFTNSLVSNIYLSASNTPTPEVGMGATIAMWSDRYAATIVEVVRFKTGQRAGQVKTVVVQRDHVKRVDTNGMSDAQNYQYSPNTQAARQAFNVNSKGQFNSKGGDKLIIGVRDEHYDYTF